MTTTQLQLLHERRKEARRVGDPKQMLELLDMAEVLLDAGFALENVAQALRFPAQGNVTSEKRLREALDINRAWPEEALLVARKYRADWHALREPARWWRNGDVEREEIVGFAVAFVDRKGRWPRTDEMRTRFGKASGHKGPGDAPGQEALL
jgi:DNA-binding transcriptional MerR regulator